MLVCSFALVSETWFTSNHGDQFVHIGGYSLFCRDRVRRKGDEVAVYVRHDIDCSLISLFNTHNILIEILWVKCCVNQCVYYIAAYYHPPYADEDFRTALASDIVALSNRPPLT